ncbi:Vacuolar protein sorting-associated protein 45 [Halotydeus destructor]|nr:Vacuolar protein sorting-associated protein 45 [Halotydeus destructor]
MDVIHGAKFYINRMVDDVGIGMKVLLMDQETTSIVSMVFSQSDMLTKEVYMFERIDRMISAENMRYLKCVAFVRPIPENIDFLKQELKSPKYGQYHIYFSNVISKTDVKAIAEADEHEVVRDVQEFYSDYVPVNPHLFSLNMVGSCYNGSTTNWNAHGLQRCVQGIVSVLLTLRKCPTIRYQASSDLCKRLAEGVRHVMSKEGSLFTFRDNTKHNSFEHSTLTIPPVLLIIDRRSDLVTPMLNQWTYQAMLHELLAIANNRISLADVPGVTKELKEVVLSSEHDDFYEKNMYLNYGEISSNIKDLMDEFQSHTKSQQKVETIADMKAFIENYPQFKRMSGTVSKHVTLIGELSRLVTARNLLEVSEAEQELACQNDHSESLKKVKRLLANDKVHDTDALRLVMLYALKYGKNSNNDVHGLQEILRSRKLTEKQIRLIREIQTFNEVVNVYGTNSGDLLSTENMKSFTKKMIKGMKGVENIYTQHSPLLKETIEELAKGRLRTSQFPYLGTVQLTERPREIIAFIVGGTTYEESLTVHNLNCTLPGVKVILGSSAVHSFRSFVEEIRSAMALCCKFLNMELDIWPGDWGLPSIDTSCLQVLAYTRFCGVPLKVNCANSSWFSDARPVFRHRTTKLTRLSDVVNHLQKENYSADFNLSKKDISDIGAYTSMLQAKLEPVIQYLWFLDDRNYTELTRPWMASKLKFPSNYIVPGQLQRNAQANLEAQYGDIEKPVMENAVFKEAQKCLTVLSERLGTNEFFIGKQPTSFDAIVFSYLAPLVKVPFPSSNHLQHHIKASDNLMSFVSRILRKYFPTVTASEPQQAETGNSDADFPNKKRDIICSGLFATLAMLSYGYAIGLIRAKYQ